MSGGWEALAVFLTSNPAPSAPSPCADGILAASNFPGARHEEILEKHLTGHSLFLKLKPGSIQVGMLVGRGWVGLCQPRAGSSCWEGAGRPQMSHPGGAGNVQVGSMEKGWQQESPLEQDPLWAPPVLVSSPGWEHLDPACPGHRLISFYF